MQGIDWWNEDMTFENDVEIGQVKLAKWES